MSGKRFLLDEAEKSGDDEEHYEHWVDEPENDEDREFIDDAITFRPSAPPPIFNIPEFDPQFIYVDNIERAIVPYVPRPTPPLKPIPKAFPKISPPKNPPPPPPAAKQDGEKFIRPRCDANKRMTQIIQSTVIPAAHVGSLTFNLVTVIPDYERSLEDCWKNAVNERALLVEQVLLLPGLFGAFVALETHPGSRPKGPEPDKKKKKGDTGAVIDDVHDDDNVPLGEQPQIKITKKNRLAGKPHYHILLFYSDTHFPRLDLSVFKRRVMLIMPKSDVNEKVLPEGIRKKDPHYVRALKYVLKGARCPSTADFWKKYIAKDELDQPPMPEFYHGPLFGVDDDSPLKESTQRFIDMLKRIAEWCKSTVPYALGEALPFFREEARRSREQKDMIAFSQLMRTLGIYVGGVTCNRFFKLQLREDYLVLHTYTEGFDFSTLQKELSFCPAAIGFLLKYKEASLMYWFKFVAIFQHVPPHKYEWVELRDGYYNVRTGLFHLKSSDEPFNNVCFRSYAYTVDELKHDEPTEWLALLNFMCERVVTATLPDVTNAGALRPIYHQVDKQALLHHLAHLLRLRYPKQPVAFLYGASNSGKSTLISFVVDLYPNAARGFLNSSVASLSGIHEDIVILHCDEFKTDIISREDLLILLDGAQPLTVRRYHQDARQINNPLMPIILADNFKPAYYNDDSKALDNRLIFFHCRRELVPDNRKATIIREQHLLTVRYLNDYLLQENKNKK